MIKQFLILCFALSCSLVLQAQSQRELIQKAKSMGVSDSQIHSALKGQQSASGKQSTTQQTRAVATHSMQVSPIDALRLDTMKVDQADIAKVDLTEVVFGREIFRQKGLTFAPTMNIATPANYVLGSGDEVRIRIWGNSEQNIVQNISPEGQVFIENLGPVKLGGLTVEAAEVRLKNELAEIYSGLGDGSIMASLSVGQTRSIKINVVGEAFMPGTYTLPAFSTIMHALYAAGGVNEIGSLRSVKLFRNNKEVSELDVYDFLLAGVSSTNARMEDGDMVMIAPYESLVQTRGEVKRERIYEMRSGESLAALLKMAGGFNGAAYSERVKVERMDGEARAIKTIKKGNFDSFEMMDGDMLTVDEIAEKYDNRIIVEGAVWYPGDYELGTGVSTVKELVEQAAGLKGDEFLGRAQITRVNPDFTETIIAIDIRGIMNGTEPDVALMKDDLLYIPAITDLRKEYTIKVSGAVNTPNDSIPFRSNMTVEDAIIVAGGLTEGAAAVNVDISRRVKDPKSTNTPSRIVEVFTVTLQDGLTLSKDGEPATLEPFDEVYVRFSPGYRKQEVVSISGEVLFKGDYVLKGVNSRLSDVVRDAGGVTSMGYVKGASLIRKMSEDEQRKVKVILNMAASSQSEGKDSVAVNMSDLQTYSVGIDLEKALKKPGSTDDIVLHDGDRLVIPKQQSTVKISGSVIYSNSVTYTPGMSVREYLRQAGGYSDYARKYPIVIYMNGKVASTRKVFIFFKRYPKIEPGCEVLVPSKRAKDRMSTPEILGITNSSISLAALITSMMNNLK